MPLSFLRINKHKAHVTLNCQLQQRALIVPTNQQAQSPCHITLAATTTCPLVMKFPHVDKHKVYATANPILHKALERKPHKEPQKRCKYH